MLRRLTNVKRPTGNRVIVKITSFPVFRKNSRKNDLFFGIMQKITTFACLFGEKP